MPIPYLNPFPGLRPFAMDERHLFFGREQQVAELLVRLRKHRFLAVVGSSGSGKSSLIRAGLLPELHGGTMRAAGSAWRVVILRPGGNPMTQLANALGDADLYGSEAGQDLPLRLGVTLERSGLGLIETVRQAALPARTNLLVVVDQFEEVFRYTENTPAARSAAAAFVRLLLEASRQAEVPIYVVLTMRSDFLGECSQFPGLAEAINQSEYLVPRLNRDQWRSAIEGPVRVGGGSIAPRLVQRLLNDVGEDPDQLPLLQHALMRTWDHWAQHHHSAEPLDLDHYEAVGGISAALSRHADEAYAELPGERERAVAARVFKALTEKSSDARGTRRPTRMTELVEIAGADLAEVQVVVEAFRQEGRAFLMPPSDLAIESKTVIDIAHESLMRAWKRLSNWAEEEAVSVRIYRRLVETALLWKDNKAGLFGDPDLELARQWREEASPTAAWARSYGPGYDAAMEFLDASIQARQAEIAAQEAARQRELAQARAEAENERLRARIRVREAQRRVWMVIGMALLALAVAAAWTAHRNSKIARSNKLAAQASTILSRDPELGLLLATNAWDVFPSLEAATLVRKSLMAFPLQLLVTNHTAPVARAVFSPDGNFFATADDAGNVALSRNNGTNGPWSRHGFAPQTLQPAHQVKLVALEFTGNSKFLVSAAGRQVRMWETDRGNLLSGTNLPSGTVKDAAISPGGARVLIAADAGGAYLWEWNAPGQPSLQALRTPMGRPQLAAFSPGGKWLALATDTNQNRLYFGANNYQIQIWAGDGSNPRHLEGHSGDASSLRFSPDDRFIATVGREGVMRLWESASGRLLAFSTNLTTDRIGKLTFHGSRILAWGQTMVQLFDTAGIESAARARELRPIRELIYPQGIRMAAMSPDGMTILTAGMDAKARLNLSSGELSGELIGHTSQINAIDSSPDGRWILTGSHDGRAMLWENYPGQFLAEPGRSARLVTAGGNGALFIGSAAIPETSLVIRSGATTKGNQAPAPASNYQPTKEVRSAAFNQQGSFIAVGDGTEVVVLDSERQSPALWRQPHPGEVRCLAFGPGERASRLAVAGESATVRVWEFDPASSGQPVWQDLESSKTNAFERIGFSLDGRRLFGLQHDDWITVWDVASRYRLAEFRQRGAECAAFDPQGHLLVIGDERGAIWLWQMEPLHPLDRQSLHRDKINDVAWSGNGLFVVSGSGDKTAIVWEVGDLKRAGGLSRIADLAAHSEPVTHVSFAAGDQSIFTADLRGGLRKHQLGDVLASDPKIIIGLAARRLSRGLDAEELKVFLNRR